MKAFRMIWLKISYFWCVSQTWITDNFWRRLTKLFSRRVLNLNIILYRILLWCNGSGDCEHLLPQWNEFRRNVQLSVPNNCLCFTWLDNELLHAKSPKFWCKPWTAYKYSLSRFLILGNNFPHSTVWIYFTKSTNFKLTLKLT